MTSKHNCAKCKTTISKAATVTPLADSNQDEKMNKKYPIWNRFSDEDEKSFADIVMATGLTTNIPLSSNITTTDISSPILQTQFAADLPPSPSANCSLIVQAVGAHHFSGCTMRATPSIERMLTQQQEGDDTAGNDDQKEVPRSPR